jgi:hypothetical protein
MADIKSLSTILAELKVHLKSRARSLDTSDNSLINDLIFIPLSVGGKGMMDQVNTVKNLHVLSTISGTDLDNEGGNYGLERLTGRKAAVYLTYYANARPLSDVVIPAGATANTAGTPFVSPVVYTVNADNRFSSVDMDAYYSHDRGRYEFTVAATCQDEGTIGNVSANLINTMSAGVSNIYGVTNLTASNGGQDVESDDDFKERIRLSTVGRDKNVSSGLQAYMRGVGFLDVSVVRAGDTGYERATGVDAFVIDSTSLATSDQFTYNLAQQRYYFTYRPVIEITSVVSDIDGILTTSEYSVNLDSDSPMRRSIYSQDYIEFVNTLSPGSTITVSYNYNSFIYQSQATLDLPENKILTTDVLLKRAYPLSLYLNATLTLKARADGPTTRNKCKSALGDFLATYRLGDDLQKSDLILVLQQGYGDYPVETVDAVVISSYYLVDEFGITYSPVDEVIAMNDKQYVIYGLATIS